MNPIFFKIGNIYIYWYSIILLIAFVIGCLVVFKESKKIGLEKEKLENFIFYTIPIALIGARVYYVLFNLDYYLKYPIDIIKVWEGGLAIHGGILAGFLCLLYFTKKNKINIFKMLDILVIGLIIGQIIGRWGNFMNSEAYGPITTLEFLKNIHLPKFIIDGMFIEGNYHHPTFLYESLWNIIGLIIILIIKNTKINKAGIITSIYLIWYGIGRFLIESLRTDSLMFLNLKIAQFVSIIFIIIGLIVLIYSIKKGEKYE